MTGLRRILIFLQSEACHLSDNLKYWCYTGITGGIGLLPEFKLTPVEKLPFRPRGMRELYIKILDEFIEAPNNISMVTVEGKTHKSLIQGPRLVIERPEYRNILEAAQREDNVYLVKFIPIQEQEE